MFAATAIAGHPDVRRMLLTMKAMTEGGRAFACYVGQQLDLAKYADEPAERNNAQALVALLTPVAKAFFTDSGLESCIHGQQVFGGHGYIREWGQEQLVRDVRIAQIYEGTNGIQALDLVGQVLHGLDQYADEIAIGDRQQAILMGHHRFGHNGRQLLGDETNAAIACLAPTKCYPTEFADPVQRASDRLDVRL